jgi:hypothetical protein
MQYGDSRVDVLILMVEQSHAIFISIHLTPQINQYIDDRVILNLRVDSLDVGYDLVDLTCELIKLGLCLFERNAVVGWGGKKACVN